MTAEWNHSAKGENKSKTNFQIYTTAHARETDETMLSEGTQTM